MKVTIAKKHLLDGLTLINSGFGRTSNLAMGFSDELCTVSGSDPTVSISIGMPITKKEGDKVPDKPIVIQIEKLLGFLKGIFDDEITVTQGAKGHLVKGSSSQISQPFSVISVPMMESLDPDKAQVVFPRSLIPCSIAKAIAPVVAGAINKIMLGVHFKTHDGEVFVHGTDSFRLASVRMKKSDDLEVTGETDIIIPLQTIHILEKFGGNEAPMLLIASEGKYQIDLSDGDLEVSIVGSQVAGTYPAVDTLLASKPEIEFEVKSTELSEKCKLHRAATMSDKVLHGRLHSSSGKLNIDTQGITSISSSIDEGFKRILGEDELDVTITFKYLLDAIPLVAISGSEKIKLGLSSQTKFVWIRPFEEHKDLEISCVIAPVG